MLRFQLQPHILNSIAKKIKTIFFPCTHQLHCLKGCLLCLNIALVVLAIIIWTETDQLPQHKSMRVIISTVIVYFYTSFSLSQVYLCCVYFSNSVKTLGNTAQKC